MTKQLETSTIDKIKPVFKKNEKGESIWSGMNVGDTHIDFNDKNPTAEALEKNEKAFKEMGGSIDSASNIYFLIDVIRSLPDGSINEKNMTNIFSFLQEMQPKDSIEARLLAQFFILHEQGLDHLRTSNKNTYRENIDSFLKYSIKLLKLSQETIQVLTKYRNQGKQQVFVTHVTEGGKAIVGNISSNIGGDGNSNNEKTSCKQ